MESQRRRARDYLYLQANPRSGEGKRWYIYFGTLVLNSSSSKDEGLGSQTPMSVLDFLFCLRPSWSSDRINRLPLNDAIRVHGVHNKLSDSFPIHVAWLFERWR